MKYVSLLFLLMLLAISFLNGCEDNQTNENSVRTCQRIDDCKGGEVCNKRGECVREELSNEPGIYTVECTSHKDCPVGYNCDSSLTNYGKCVKQSGNLGG